MAREHSDGETSYKTGEVCRIAGIQPYVLRYWESEFPALAAGRAAAGARVYSASELELVRRIKSLLYDEGYTIAGARRKLEGEPAPSEPVAVAPAEAVPTSGGAEPVAVGAGARRRPRRAPAAGSSIDTPRAAGLNAAAAELNSIAETLDQLAEFLASPGGESPKDRQ